MKQLLIMDQALENVVEASIRSETLILRALELGVELDYVSLASEGEWVDAMQGAAGVMQGVAICPPSAMKHSIALRDAIAAVHLPVIEVYFESAQQEGSMLSAVCKGCICGFGVLGLSLALEALAQEDEGVVK